MTSFFQIFGAIEAQLLPFGLQNLSELADTEDFSGEIVLVVELILLNF